MYTHTHIYIGWHRLLVHVPHYLVMEEKKVHKQFYALACNNVRRFSVFLHHFLEWDRGLPYFIRIIAWLVSIYYVFWQNGTFHCAPWQLLKLMKDDCSTHFKVLVIHFCSSVTKPVQHTDSSKLSACRSASTSSNTSAEYSTAETRQCSLACS